MSEESLTPSAQYHEYFTDRQVWDSGTHWVEILKYDDGHKDWITVKSKLPYLPDYEKIMPDYGAGKYCFTIFQQSPGAKVKFVARIGPIVFKNMVSTSPIQQASMQTVPGPGPSTIGTHHPSMSQPGSHEITTLFSQINGKLESLGSRVEDMQKNHLDYLRGEVEQARDSNRKTEDYHRSTQRQVHDAIKDRMDSVEKTLRELPELIESSLSTVIRRQITELTTDISQNFASLDEGFGALVREIRQVREDMIVQNREMSHRLAQTSQQSESQLISNEMKQQQDATNSKIAILEERLTNAQNTNAVYQQQLHRMANGQGMDPTLVAPGLPIFAGQTANAAPIDPLEASLQHLEKQKEYNDRLRELGYLPKEEDGPSKKDENQFTSIVDNVTKIIDKIKPGEDGNEDSKEEKKNPLSNIPTQPIANPQGFNSMAPAQNWNTPPPTNLPVPGSWSVPTNVYSNANSPMTHSQPLTAPTSQYSGVQSQPMTPQTSIAQQVPSTPQTSAAPQIPTTPQAFSTGTGAGMDMAANASLSKPSYAQEQSSQTWTEQEYQNILRQAESKLSGFKNELTQALESKLEPSVAALVVSQNLSHEEVESLVQIELDDAVEIIKRVTNNTPAIQTRDGERWVENLLSSL